MHRTQILLETSQYEFLCQEARSLKVSLSELIRQLVRERMSARPDEDDPLDRIAGIGEDPDGYGGRDHDLLLYGWDKS